MASAICRKLAYLPVPTISLELNSRPAIISLSVVPDMNPSPFSCEVNHNRDRAGFSVTGNGRRPRISLLSAANKMHDFQSVSIFQDGRLIGVLRQYIQVVLNRNPTLINADR